MVIKIIAVGKIKEKYWSMAIEEYLKRLSKYCKIEVLEIEEEKISIENESYQLIAKEKEGQRILKKLEGSQKTILLDLRGKELDSLAFASFLDKIKNESSTICFIIGGSYGVSEEVCQKADYVLSFSRLTFPHQLFRVLLCEQIYRAFKILNNEKYHK